MPINKRKKVTKQRAHTTHGWGSMKKHRGAGNRGGRGMAGSGKRADQKKSMILKKFGNEYFGKKGFYSLRKKTKALNIKDLENNINELTTKENSMYLFDLKKKGYHKLLGLGEIKNKFKIIGLCSAKAKEKIESAGGEILNE